MTTASLTNPSEGANPCKLSKKEEVKTFSIYELPRLEPNIKSTDSLYTITDGIDGIGIHNGFKTILFKSEAKYDILIVYNSSNNGNEVKKALYLEYYFSKYLIHLIEEFDFKYYFVCGCKIIYHVDNDESDVINNYVNKIKNESKFPLIRYKKMLDAIILENRKINVNESDYNKLNDSGCFDDFDDKIRKLCIDDLYEAFKDKTKRKNFIKYSTLEERREAKLNQRRKLANTKEICEVCKCEVRCGGITRHRLTIKHKNNMKLISENKIK